MGLSTIERFGEKALRKTKLQAFKTILCFGPGMQGFNSSYIKIRTLPTVGLSRSHPH